MRSILLLALMVFVAAFPAVAAIESQLFLDAGGGVTATIDVNTGGIVTCAGTCGGLTSVLTNGDHGTLQVTGTLGTFTINATGQGGASSTYPTLQNFNQIEVSNSGAGVLTAIYTDTDYTTFGANFILSASTVNDFNNSTGTTNFTAYVSGANAVPAGTLLGTLAGLTGLSDADASIVANPVGTSGSLSAKTIINFVSTGTIQANFSIATTPIPEPTSVVLFGSILLGTGLTLRRRYARK